MVNLLLRKGANVSAKDKKERQPIHWAAYLGKYFLKITPPFANVLTNQLRADDVGGWYPREMLC